DLPSRPPRITPRTAVNSKSSNCCRVTGARPFAIRLRPSRQPAAKPTRYMRPYQRTASGPMENAIGSIFGWTNITIAAYSTGDTAHVVQPAQPPDHPGRRALAQPGDAARGRVRRRRL